MGPTIFISEVTSISHGRDPEYYLLSEEWNPVQKTPKQILLSCKFGGSQIHRTACFGISWGPYYVTDKYGANTGWKADCLKFRT
jgi:hypothetical protein